MNDRLDVALAEQAGGVHLGENSLPVDEAKRLLRSSPAAQTPASDFILGRLLPFARGRQIRRLRWCQLHFLRPRLRHALKSRLRCASGSRSSRSGLQLREHSCPGHRRNHSDKRFLVPFCRCIRHRRHPPLSGRRRSRQYRGRHSPLKSLTRRQLALRLSDPSTGAAAESAPRDKHREKPRHKSASETLLPGAYSELARQSPATPDAPARATPYLPATQPRWLCLFLAAERNCSPAAQTFLFSRLRFDFAPCISNRPHALSLPRCYVAPHQGAIAACLALTPRIACLRLGPCQVFFLYASSSSLNTSSCAFTMFSRRDFLANSPSLLPSLTLSFLSLS